jgi:hypothetical protein
VSGDERSVSETASGPRLLRRYLLGLLTALIVARPLVLGEDAGMLSPLTDASNLVLTFLWLVAVFGWALWRWWSGEGRWYFGAVEAVLLVAVVAVGVGAASVASYKHAAHLVAWEWLVLFAALFLMRQLADKEADRRGLLAAFLASVVSLSAYALYQYGVELPQERTELAKREKRSTGPAEMPGLLATGGPAGALLREQFRAEIQESLTAYEAQAARRQQARSSAFATYLRPESFAALLVLFLPALAAAALVRWRQQGSGWLTWLTAGCVLLALAALWATQVRVALLALAAVGLVALLACGRQVLQRKGLALFALAGLAGVALLGWVVPSSVGGQSFQDLRECWSSTWDLIRAHVWLGAGAGNFSRLHPQYLSPAAAGSVSDAQDFVLGLWATYGIVVLAAVLLALGLFFYLALRSCPPQENPASEQRTTEGQRTSWEFYIGGMFGLLLGYFLRQAFQSPDEALLSPGLPSEEEVLRRGLVAGGRSVIWFAAFALFEGVPWTSKTLARALAASVAALLVTLTVAGGIDFPSVAQPMWLAIGLALTACGIGLHRSSADRWLGRALPLPLLAGLLLAYLPTVFYPVLRSASLAHGALQKGSVFLDQQRQRFFRMRDPRGYLENNIIKPLIAATEADPTDAHRRVQLAFWSGEMWRLSFDLRSKTAYALRAFRALLGAEKLDPNGKEAYVLHAYLHRSLGRQAAIEKERRQQFALAAKTLQQLAEVDPTNARVRYDLAVMLFAAGDAAAGRAAAQEARRLDEITHPRRQLTLVQRRQLGDWLDKRD